MPSVSTAVRCIDGSAAIKTRFEFVYPTGPLSSRLYVVVDGRAVPSVAGSNVHLVVRPIRSLAILNAAAAATLLAGIPLALIVNEIAIALPVALTVLAVNAAATLVCAGHVRDTLRAALPGWPE